MRLGMYALKRLIMALPTLFGITTVTFILVNLAPGSPVDQKLDQIKFGSLAKSGAHGGPARGNQGVSQAVIDALKKQYGFDKPLIVRYGIWLRNIACLDFGESFVYGRPTLDV